MLPYQLPVYSTTRNDLILKLTRWLQVGQNSSKTLKKILLLNFKFLEQLFSEHFLKKIDARSVVLVHLKTTENTPYEKVTPLKTVCSKKHLCICMLHILQTLFLEMLQAVERSFQYYPGELATSVKLEIFGISQNS